MAEYRLSVRAFGRDLADLIEAIATVRKRLRPAPGRGVRDIAAVLWLAGAIAVLVAGAIAALAQR